MQSRRHNSGFTLIELLVVVAITAILLALIFGPMVGGFQFLQTGRAKVQAQDTARNALETMSREVSASAYVFNSALRWDRNANGGAGAFVWDRTRIDFLLPGRSLPEFPEGMQLTFPVIPTGKVVVYFIGLKDASWDAGGYHNAHVNDEETEDDNFYWLFRAEFNPFKPPDDDDPNPCYDPKCDPDSGQYESNPDNWDWRKREWLDWSGPNVADFSNIPEVGGASTPANIAANVVARREYLRSRGEITAMVPLSNCDMVGATFDPNLGASGEYVVSYGLEFLPEDVVSEILKSLDELGQSYALETPPTTYAPGHGHWTGLMGNGTLFYGPDDLGQYCGDPRVEVYSGQTKVFDSAIVNDPLYRQRTLAFDSERGQVAFATPPKTMNLPLSDSAYRFLGPGGGTMYYYRIFESYPDTNDTSRLVEDRVKVTVRPPSGALIELDPASRNPLPFSALPRHRQGDAPQSFILERIEDGPYKGGYVIKLDTEFVDEVLAKYPFAMLDIEYQTQDNLASDVVRASYGTNELLTARLNVRVYDNVSRFPAQIVVTGKITSHNMRR